MKKGILIIGVVIFGAIILLIEVSVMGCAFDSINDIFHSIADYRVPKWGFMFASSLMLLINAATAIGIPALIIIFAKKKFFSKILQLFA